jgi:hypothetical protein
MKYIRFTLLGVAFVYLCGCATKQETTTYWSEKSGVAVVHHIVGKVDSIEKLSEKPLPSDQVADLPKGKYFQVVETEQRVDPPAKPVKPSEPKPKQDIKKDGDESKLAEVTNEIRDLKGEIATVVAQNQRLQEEIDRAGAQQAPPQEAAAPRLSQ